MRNLIFLFLSYRTGDYEERGEFTFFEELNNDWVSLLGVGVEREREGEGLGRGGGVGEYFLRAKSMTEGEKGKEAELGMGSTSLPSVRVRPILMVGASFGMLLPNQDLPRCIDPQIPFPGSPSNLPFWQWY